MRTIYTLALLAAVAGAAVVAEPLQDQNALIALDKEWGQAGMKDDKATLGRILADDSVSVDGTGVTGKAEQIATNEPVDDPNAMYEADDFEVKFLNPETAIMTHSTPDHYSLHVWAMRGGNWQVVATASVPRE